MMHRLTIAHEITPDGPYLSPPPDPQPFRIAGQGDGLDQIAAYAINLSAMTGQMVVAFEVFWPWETEATQTWDAVEVDVSKILANDPADWWVKTLPPYAELSADERARLGIEGDYA